jgi:hypothetical protein
VANITGAVFSLHPTLVVGLLTEEIFECNLNTRAWASTKMAVFLYIQLHNFYSSPSTIKMITSMRIRLTGHVACMRTRGMDVGYRWENQQERDH